MLCFNNHNAICTGHRLVRTGGDAQHSRATTDTVVVVVRWLEWSVVLRGGGVWMAFYEVFSSVGLI